MANHKQNEWVWKGKKFKVNAGQFVTSLESIAKKSGKGISIQNIRTALAYFEKLGFLINKSTKMGRLITIVNWESYQLNEINQQRNQPLPNKELTLNNNERNNNISKFIPPSIQEINDYCIERKNNIDAEYFFNYYESAGCIRGKTKIKDWKRVILTWEKNSKASAKNDVSQCSTIPEKQQYTEYEQKCIKLGLPFDAVISD